MKMVRAFVKMPIPMPALLSVYEYAVCCFRLEQELIRQGFSCETVPYEIGKRGMDRCLRDLRTGPVDTVLWLFPDKNAKSVATRLVVEGAQVISLNDRPIAASLRHYRLSRDRAILKGLIAWKDEGIKTAVIARQSLYETHWDIARIEQLLQEVDLPYRFASLGKGDPEQISRFIESLATWEEQPTGIIVAVDRFAALLCCRAPEAMSALFEKQRVMLASGPAAMPLFPTPPVPVDLVDFDWQSIAERIAADLLDPEQGFASGKPVVFEATWHPRTPLDQFLTY